MSNLTSRIRIRTPKWIAIRRAGWVKELLMTFVGATLSIILTFGTAHFVDQKQQREDGRQMAMMVIHDMEHTAEVFRSYVSQEEQNFNVAQFVLADAPTIANVPTDSIILFVSYITASAGRLYNYDNSSEQVFLSSQEAWKTINSPSFIDAVQTYFHTRQQIYDLLNHDRLYAKPISNDRYYDMLLASPNVQDLDTAFWVNYATTYLYDKSVRRYIDFSYARRRYLNRYADEFVSIANRCKFMMGITDEELARYVQNQTRTGKPLTAKKLIGTWRVQTADDLYSEREFRKDHTFTTRIHQYMSYSIYTGQIALRCTFNGTWQLKGDSLITTVLPDYSFEFDRSGIHYQPEMESAIDALLSTWEPSVIEQLNAIVSNDAQPYRAMFASIDATGNKIELHENDAVLYLTRMPKP